MLACNLARAVLIVVLEILIAHDDGCDYEDEDEYDCDYDYDYEDGRYAEREISMKADHLVAMLMFVTLGFVSPSSAAQPPAAKTFNVRDFGAAGDGIRDDTAAILKAIKAAADAGGGQVLLPPSEKPYLVTDSILVDASNIRLTGTGATVLLKDGASIGRTDPQNYLHIVHVKGTPQAPVENVIIEGVTIDANFWGQGATSSWQESARKAGHPRGLKVIHARKVLVDRVTIRRPFVGLTFGLGCFDCEARNTTVTLWHHDAFGASPENVSGGCGNIRFVRCRAVNSPNESQGGLPGSRIKGWEVEDGAQNVRLEECVVANAGGGGFYVRIHALKNRDQLVRNIEFIRCRAKDVTGDGWFIRGWDHRQRTRNVRLVNCRSNAPVSIVVGAENVKITGGEFAATMRLGFYSDFLSNLSTAKRYGYYPVRSVEIEGATVKRLIINAQKGHDGAADYLPRITLNGIKTAKGISVLTASGSPGQVRTVGPGPEPVVVMKDCDFGAEDFTWQDVGCRAYEAAPLLQKPTLRASRCKEAPRIDGRGRDACWTWAEHGEITHNPERPEGRTGQSFVRVCYDDQALYLLFDCLERSMDMLRITGKNRDDDIWLDDCVEIFFHREDDPPAYFRQWMIGAAGVFYDGDNKGAAWNSSAEVAAGRLADRYVVEIAIPWKDLGGPPRKGETWKANFARGQATDGTRWIWSWQYTPSVIFGDTAKMGSLAFE